MLWRGEDAGEAIHDARFWHVSGRRRQRPDREVHKNVGKADKTLCSLGFHDEAINARSVVANDFQGPLEKSNAPILSQVDVFKWIIRLDSCSLSRHFIDFIVCRHVSVSERAHDTLGDFHGFFAGDEIRILVERKIEAHQVATNAKVI